MKCNIATSLLLFCCWVPTFAQEEHLHSDVEFGYVNGAIAIEPGAEGFVFEAEFGEGAFAYHASEPGIASESDEGHGINSHNIIGFNVLGNLFFWNGTQFSSPGDATITISGAGGAGDTIVSASSGVQRASFSTPANLLGQADDSGNFHVDPGFTINPQASAGGYGLILSLSTNDPTGITDSAPFGVFLNFGLDESSFEAGVEAFSAIVPEPNSLALLVGTTAIGIGLLRRRR